jgi:DNA-binding CsgD family transcriptional regulator
VHGVTPCRQLIGRSAERRLLRAMIGPGDRRPDGALVVLGDIGIGKSALLADVAVQASAAGLRVLSVAGRERESGQALAGLRRLLRPAFLDLLASSGQNAEELRAALGLNPCFAERDRFRVAAGLAELLARHACGADGVLVLADDAQWLDSASLDVLALATHCLGAGFGPVILAARGCLPPAGFEDVADVRLGPLTETEARELLEALPTPPRGHLKMQVMSQAEGNPLALAELARAVEADATAGRRWSGLPLPLTDRLGALFAAELGKLPLRTRQALLLPAVADRADRAAAAGALLSLNPAVLAPAEESGLITVDAAGPLFRHPLIRSAVYHGAPFAIRAAAHREMAALLRDQPDRRAWHLAAAALVPDEGIASLLASTAARAEQRGGATASAVALERATDLTPDPRDQAKRLVVAAETAVSARQAGWAADLACRALDLGPGPDLVARAQAVTGWALACAGRHVSAMGILLPLARQAAHRDPTAAWKLIGLGATAAYHSGEPDLLKALADTLAAAPPATDDKDETQAARLWVLAASGQTSEATVLLGELAGRATDGYSLSRTGAAAWLLDQTACAVELLHAARDAFTHPGTGAHGDGSLGELAWACLDAGQWDEALDLAAEERATLDISPALGNLLSATIEAARGNTESARTLITAALAANKEHSRLVIARARHALGLAALADGDFAAAFDQLCPLFDDDGKPYHQHASYLAIGDLAAAAQRAGHRRQGREIVKRVSAVLAAGSQSSSPRTRQLLARADAILADQSTPDAYPAGVTCDPAEDQRPFDRAQFRLEQGEWLRRRRRINQAKPVLSAALDTFRALRALPWAHRAEAELRACGIPVPGTAPRAAGLMELTPQQRLIITLAAQGLTNTEIARRTYLSPRTVASHLYRSFPKLGVAGRHQLHGVLSGDGRPA